MSNSFDAGKLDRFLDHYRQVVDVAIVEENDDRRRVDVTIDSPTSFYDSDAIIGTMVRKFDCEYVDEENADDDSGNVVITFKETA